jgi:hypothetical protein
VVREISQNVPDESCLRKGLRAVVTVRSGVFLVEPLAGGGAGSVEGQNFVQLLLVGLLPSTDSSVSLMQTEQRVTGSIIALEMRGVPATLGFLCLWDMKDEPTGC